MNIYSTKDFYLSSLLMSNDFKLISSEKKTEGVYFNFLNHNDNLLKELINNFVNYQAMVNMRKFTASLTRLRKELDKYKN